MKPRSKVSKTLTDLYGSGHYNPRSFTQRPPAERRRLYAWGISLLLLAIVLATGLGLYLFARTPDSFTGERVKFTLDGPVTAPIGGDSSYTAQIVNNEEVDLTDVEIFVGYNQIADNAPAQVRVVRANDAEVIDNKNSWPLDTIKQGGTKTFSLVLRFSGQEGSELTLPLSLRFKPKGFSSDLKVDLEQKFLLSRSVINLSLAGPSAAAPGSELTFTAAIAKNSSVESAKLGDWMLRFNAPDSFKITGFEPARPDNADSWRLGDLPLAGDNYQLVIHGTVAAVVGDKLTVSAELRSPEANAGVIKQEKAVTVQSSSATITLSAAPGSGKKLQWDEALIFKAVVTNTGDTALKSAVVSVNLVGEDWWQSDSLAIKSNGFFEGGNVNWDEKTVPALASLEPKQSQILEFSLKTRTESRPAESTGAPAITAKAKLRAQSGDEEVVVDSDEVNTKILANVEFDASGSAVTGQSNAYTLVWKLDKSSSELKDLRISAPLGKNVKWLAVTDYSVGELTYNESSRSVIWQASKIPKITEPININFTVSLAPTDAAASAVLLSQSNFKATDSLANESLEMYANGVKVSDVK